MKTENFSYSFTSPKTADAIFKCLLDVRQWWSGLHEETITGESRQPGDEFAFEAGGGMHYTRQKLVELIPAKRIVWLVTESKLTFIEDQSEWNGTRISFDLKDEDGRTRVSFTHEGLVPEIDCYSNCSSAWTAYLDNLKKALS